MNKGLVAALGTIAVAGVGAIVKIAKDYYNTKKEIKEADEKIKAIDEAIAAVEEKYTDEEIENESLSDIMNGTKERVQARAEEANKRFGHLDATKMRKEIAEITSRLGNKVTGIASRVDKQNNQQALSEISKDLEELNK